MPGPPGFLDPFVLPGLSAEPERHGNVDLYLPPQGGPRPAVVFVHGGPVAEELRPTPRQWPVYIGYGTLAATHGLVGVTLDHRLHDLGDYPRAATDVAHAVDLARQHERVDEDQIALWFFSGGGLLAADWLREPPGWLRCLALTYPLLAPLPSWQVDPRFRPVDAVRGSTKLAITLTRVGLERTEIAATVEEFLSAAHSYNVRLEVIDVPQGQHGFDVLDHTDESREAVTHAMQVVSATLT